MTRADAPALTRIKVNQSSRVMSEFAPNDWDDLDLDAPYQRGHVWGEERQRNLVRSMLQGLPIGAVFVNLRSEDAHPVVVDGKQRITAMRDFMAGRLRFPAAWVPPEDRLGESEPDAEGHISFLDLTQSKRRRLRLGVVVAVYETHLPDEQAEHELFELINHGGVPQGARDDDAPEPQ